MRAGDWVTVCDVESLEPGRGVRALVGGRAVAVFLVPPTRGSGRRGEDAWDDRVFAIGDLDPCTGASVLSRGLLGAVTNADGVVLYVASPLRKDRFALRDGTCLTRPGLGAGAWPVRVADERLLVGTTPTVEPQGG